MIYMMWILAVANTLWLRHIDLLGEMPIEKGVINIKLAQALLGMECNAEHNKDNDGIDHGTESLMKINTRLLMKAFSNKSSFIPNNRTIRILFDAKTPFVAYYVLPWARGNERLSVVLNESIILVLHGLNPLQILEISGDSVGFRDRWKDDGEAISRVGFDDGTFRFGLHRMMVEWESGSMAR